MLNRIKNIKGHTMHEAAMTCYHHKLDDIGLDG